MPWIPLWNFQIYSAANTTRYDNALIANNTRVIYVVSIVMCVEKKHRKWFSNYSKWSPAIYCAILIVKWAERMKYMRRVRSCMTNKSSSSGKRKRHLAFTSHRWRTCIVRFLRAEWHPNLLQSTTYRRRLKIIWYTRGELYPTHSNRRDSRLPVEDCTAVQRLVRCAFRSYARFARIARRPSPVARRLRPTISITISL